MSQRAFSDNYDYYRLMKPCLGLKAGAIFYHDKEDQELGSIGLGCLKLAWDADGNCDLSNVCADTYILHANAIKDEEYLQKININKDEDFIIVLKDKINEWFQSNAESGLVNQSAYFTGEASAFLRVMHYIDILINTRRAK